MAAISAVFTNDHVAELLAEGGQFLVCGIGEVEVSAFTCDGIECLKQLIADE